MSKATHGPCGVLVLLLLLLLLVGFTMQGTGTSGDFSSLLVDGFVEKTRVLELVQGAEEGAELMDLAKHMMRSMPGQTGDICFVEVKSTTGCFGD